MTYDLYNGTPPHNESNTSLAAAESMKDAAKRLADQVFVFIQSRSDPSVPDYGVTCDQVEEVFNLTHQTISARIRELVLKDRVIDSGARRLTRSKRKAIVWVEATEERKRMRNPLGLPVGEVTSSVSMRATFIANLHSYRGWMSAIITQRCRACNGEGEMRQLLPPKSYDATSHVYSDGSAITVVCPSCNGTGLVPGSILR